MRLSNTQRQCVCTYLTHHHVLNNFKLLSLVFGNSFDFSRYLPKAWNGQLACEDKIPPPPLTEETSLTGTRSSSTSIMGIDLCSMFTYWSTFLIGKFSNSTEGTSLMSIRTRSIGQLTATTIAVVESTHRPPSQTGRVDITTCG